MKIYLSYQCSVVFFGSLILVAPWVHGDTLVAKLAWGEWHNSSIERAEHKDCLIKLSFELWNVFDPYIKSNENDTRSVKFWWIKPNISYFAGNLRTSIEIRRIYTHHWPKFDRFRFRLSLFFLGNVWVNHELTWKSFIYMF